MTASNSALEPRLVLAQRALALALIAVQAATLFWMAHVTVFPSVLLGFAAVLCFGGWSLNLSRRAQLVLYLILAIAFAAKGFWLPLRDLERPAIQIAYPRSYAIAQFLMVVQALAFLVARSRRMRPSLPFYGVVVMMFAGNVQSNGQLDLGYRLLALTFVLVAGFYAGTSVRRDKATRRRRSLTRAAFAGGVLVLALGGAWGTSVFLEAIEDDVEQFVFNLGWEHKSSSAGFTSQSRLGSVASQKQSDREAIALRVFTEGKVEPGYFRAKTYTWFQNSVWTSMSAQESQLSLRPNPEEIPEPKPDWGTFSIGRRGQTEWVSGGGVLGADSRADGSGVGPRPAPGFLVDRVPDGNSGGQGTAVRPSLREMRVLSSASCGPSIFSTRSTRFVQARADQLLVGDDQTLLALTRTAAADTSLFDSPVPRRDSISRDQRRDCLAVPNDLDPRIRDLAKAILPDDAPTRLKADLIEEYFLNNYEYHVGIDIPPGIDPLTYFLIQKPRAHCEYFASGAAILLRLAGVPCRYVTGFVVREHNSLGDYWIARNQDSHAWVEAWDDTTGWFIVEATPPDGVPQVFEEGPVARVWEYLKSRIRMAWAFLRSGWPAIAYGVARGAQALGGFLFRTAAGLLLLIICALYVAWRIWRKRRMRTGRKIDPVIQAGNRLLAELESRLARYNAERAPYETLHQFAIRLESLTEIDEFPRAAASWIRDYARNRYGGHWTADRVEALRNRMPAPTASR